VLWGGTKIMRVHSFVVTFVECRGIIRGISNIASLVVLASGSRIIYARNALYILFLFSLLLIIFYCICDNHRPCAYFAELKNCFGLPPVFVLSWCEKHFFELLGFHVIRKNDLKKNLVHRFYSGSLKALCLWQNWNASWDMYT